jgi:hypothetical protein
VAAQNKDLAEPLRESLISLSHRQESTLEGGKYSKENLPSIKRVNENKQGYLTPPGETNDKVKIFKPEDLDAPDKSQEHFPTSISHQ